MVLLYCVEMDGEVVDNKIAIKDMNTIASEALHTIKFVCETFNGSCKQCPIGLYTKGEYGMTYKCAFKECTPRFFKIKSVKPFRLIEGMYREVEVNEGD